MRRSAAWSAGRLAWMSVITATRCMPFSLRCAQRRTCFRFETFARLARDERRDVRAHGDVVVARQDRVGAGADLLVGAPSRELGGQVGEDVGQAQLVGGAVGGDRVEARVDEL